VEAVSNFENPAFGQIQEDEKTEEVTDDETDQRDEKTSYLTSDTDTKSTFV